MIFLTRTPNHRWRRLVAGKCLSALTTGSCLFVLSLGFLAPYNVLAASSTAVGGLTDGGEARALGMGGAYTAIADGPDSLFWNPAGLARSQSFEFLLNHQLFLDVLTQDVGAVAVPALSGRIGLGYSQLKSDSMSRTDVNGNATGSFGAKDQLLMTGFAMPVRFGAVGASVKFIKSSLDSESASAYAVDAGVDFGNHVFSRLRHAFVVQNLGSKLKYDGVKEDLPLRARFGTSFRPGHQVQIGLDFVYEKNGSVDVAGGGELSIPFRKDIGAFLRAGYGSRRSDAGDLAGLGLGAGLSIVSVRLDYAWTPSDDLGGSQIFTLTYKFGDTTSRPAALQNSLTQETKPAEPRPVYSLDIPFTPKPLGEPVATQPIGGSDRKSRVYVVKEGDTLKGLAQRFYGKSDLWINIQNANRFLLGSNTDLAIGQKILLPE